MHTVRHDNLKGPLTLTLKDEALPAKPGWPCAPQSVDSQTVGAFQHSTGGRSGCFILQSLHVSSGLGFVASQADSILPSLLEIGCVLAQTFGSELGWSASGSGDTAAHHSW